MVHYLVFNNQHDMKRILVPTDFSEFAHSAYEAARRFAERFDARVHLLHVLDLPADWTALSETQKAAYPVEKKRVEEAEALLADWRADNRGVEVQVHYAGGKLKEAVLDFVTQREIELVIMGSHGKSGKSEFFIGSNTQKIVRTVHCPVLVVKEPMHSLNFDEVVFASSFNENERRPFLAFKNFVKHFLPRIHLVYIDTASLFDPPYIVNKEAMEDFKALCKPFDAEVHIFKDLTVDRGIRQMAQQLGASLIGISNHHRHPLRRMLVGSNVEALVNHASLPVLSIDYPAEE